MVTLMCLSKYCLPLTSSNRSASVTSKDEHDPAHAGTLGQLLLTFYAYGDRFVKFVVTPEAQPEEEPVNTLLF